MYEKGLAWIGLACENGLANGRGNEHMGSAKDKPRIGPRIGTTPSPQHSVISFFYCLTLSLSVTIHSRLSVFSFKKMHNRDPL